ncbi:hypothetical protein CLV98_10757 [Dyadobacter jejuensis]|uniref:Uncharacterized protein n=1 Tax=Dyadobacter jejuensis TaxID=1082580 RepID=A0A316AKE7_9BACT|nr:DsrE family protein [Dyadobacter jejuensis]PWJ57350.1 hypothetical protein CLV98_10757 [Dyadobacter jejuensis]
METTDTPQKDYKTVVQLTSDEPRVFKSMIRQIGNLLDYLDGRVSVEIICHGASAAFCRKDDNPFQAELQALQARGVLIMACIKMLDSASLNQDQLLEKTIIIPSGIGRLVLRQHEGWSYIRAGI